MQSMIVMWESQLLTSRQGLLSGLFEPTKVIQVTAPYTHTSMCGGLGGEGGVGRLACLRARGGS